MGKQNKSNPKEQLLPIDAYYQCLLNCKINPSSGSWIGLEEECEKDAYNNILNQILCSYVQV